jgi:hypothetical protein
MLSFYPAPGSRAPAAVALANIFQGLQNGILGVVQKRLSVAEVDFLNLSEIQFF